MIWQILSERRNTKISVERIFYVMEQKNIMQLELSRRTGIATSNISDWKKKKTNPKADIRILKQIHSLGDEQYKRLMAYMKALQKLEQMERIVED